MAMQFAAPIIVDDIDQPENSRRLHRLRTSVQKASAPQFLEKFLQRLIHAEPSILPVEELEPSFRDLRSVCQELPLGEDRNKFLDNLLINSDGRICLVECKLWRNPESIRTVVAQILDYAGELACLSYNDLSASVRRALPKTVGDPLIERVLGPGADEDDHAPFIDAVSRSLQRGDFLLLIVGDGIRNGLQQIAGLLQNRATLGFSLALIEMAVYGDANAQGPYYIQPRRLLQTEIITRNVFISGEKPTTFNTAISEGERIRAQTISEADYLAQLKTADPSYPSRLQEFLQKARQVGCQPELRRGYVLYVNEPTGGRINLGSINRDGSVSIWGAGSHDHQYGEPVGQRYMERVVSFLSEASIKDEFPNRSSWYVRYRGKSTIPLDVMLRHELLWLDAVREVAERLQQIDTN